jgi:hypothetical protein
MEKLIKGRAVAPTRKKPKHLPRMLRRFAELGKGERKKPQKIPKGSGQRHAEQSPGTSTAPAGTGPNDGDHRVIFQTYTPNSTPANGGPIPPDPSGATGASDVVLYTGNSYLMASVNGGGSFTEHDTTKFLSAAQGRPVDQVMIYVPHRRLVAWMMQHQVTPATGDGNFRLAVANLDDVLTDVETAWTVYDFTSTDAGQAGSATDRQDLSYSESRLYMTTSVDKGRVVMSLSLDDLVAKRKVNWGRTKPLDDIFHFSDLSQQNSQNVHSVAIVDSNTLRVMTLNDSTGTYDFHDVDVGDFPKVDNLSSLDPDKNDWLTRGVPNVSASVVRGDNLWVAWDAAASTAGDQPFYPNAHVRLARIDFRNWTTVEERQVWNPDYAFAYCCLAIGPDGDIGYGVGVGGSKDYPNSCFGILGDYVVYFRDDSTATAGAGSEPRWGDYITVRPSTIDSRRFAAFGYFTKKSGGGADQQPFYLSYGRP